MLLSRIYLYLTKNIQAWLIALVYEIMNEFISVPKTEENDTVIFKIFRFSRHIFQVKYK